MSYIGNEPIVSATRTVTEAIATAGQTVFNVNGGYTTGFLDVILNGSQLTSADYTATDGNTVTLTQAALAGDEIRMEAWGTFQISSALTTVNPSYTGTLTGGTGVVNLGSGQFYKDASGNVGIGTTSPTTTLEVKGTTGTVAVGSSTGTNETWFRASNSAGNFWLGRDNSTGSYFGTAYAAALYSDGAYPMTFYTNGTERMRINANSAILCLSGGNTSATGTGIAFPATQSASTDANTLDDYEEGTWTPTISVTQGTATFVSSSGNYRKVGSMVTVAMTFAMSSMTGAQLAVSGLPFAMTTSSPFYSSGVMREFNTTGNFWALTYPLSTTAIYLNRYDNVNTITAGGTYSWSGTFTYFTT